MSENIILPFVVGVLNYDVWFNKYFHSAEEMVFF